MSLVPTATWIGWQRNLPDGRWFQLCHGPQQMLVWRNILWMRFLHPYREHTVLPLGMHPDDRTIALPRET